MKLNTKTLKVISNFSTIAPSMTIEPGNAVSVMSVAKNVIAYATVEDTFTDKMNIPQTALLLNALGVIEEPELEFSPKGEYFIIKGSNGSMQLAQCEDKFVSQYKGKKLDLSSRVADIDIPFPAEFLENCRKISASIKLDSFVITNNSDDKVVIMIQNSELSANNNKNNYTYETNEPANGKKFEFFIDASTIKNIPGDYRLKIYDSRVAQFEFVPGEDNDDNFDITYWVSLDPRSHCQ